MPNNPIDTHRGLKIISPLEDDLICHSFSGQDHMGRLFEYQLDLRSPNLNIPFQDIVGQRVTVSMELESGDRYFNGFVSEFRFSGQSGQFASYKATLKPWLWFLTRTADCRIFQNQTVPDIIKSVFADNGMSDFEVRLSDTYREWNYCVQYRETDFNFVSRLMEQEGIYYYFEHTEKKHALVLADGLGAHKTFPGYENIPYFPPDSNRDLREKEHLQQWEVRQLIVPGKYAIKDFDFEKPKVDLTTRLRLKPKHAYPIDNHEIFDYPGEYTEIDDGDTYVDKKLQELQAQHERVQASGNAKGMDAGCLFTLEHYPRKDQNKEYLIISVFHEIRSDTFETTSSGDRDDFYHCHLELMDSAQHYRSERMTPKPFVQGPQTAIVVGPSDEEIYCDEYARVKVQFHWDRYGESNQNSSCWVRVSQAWAGKEWGGIHIPRIGQEVVVSFLEGDPDQPLITGRVYNASNMPPYELEANKTQSGIKSRSSKGGTPDNFNEIRMEDKKGSEELYIQAEKDENILVKNDKSETVGHNETISIGNDRVEMVGHDETLTVANNRIRNVGVDESIAVGRMRTHTVGVNEAIAIGVSQEIVIGVNQSTAVGATQSTTVGANQSNDVGGAQSISVGKDRSLAVGKNHSISVGDSESRSVGKNMVVDVGDSITIKCGAASISMKKNGDIVIKGKNLVLKGSSKIDVKASSTVTIKGSKVLEN